MRLHLDGDLRYAEKLPSNSMVVPYLLRSFPDAQFVHLIRDGRDVALSFSRTGWLSARFQALGRSGGGSRFGPQPRYWVEPHRHEQFRTTSDIHRCIWNWRVHTEAVLRAVATLPADRYLEVRYEALGTRPREEADRILDFLVIGTRESRNRFRIAVARARTDSIGYWRTILTAEQLQDIEFEAGSLLRRLGYE